MESADKMTLQINSQNNEKDIFEHDKIVENLFGT